MPVDWRHASWLAVAIFVAIGVLLGVLGRRFNVVRMLLVVLAPMCSAVPLLYYMVEGSVSRCSGADATLRCTEVTYASSWGVAAWTVVGVVIVLTLAPILSAVLRKALPSVLVAVGLPILLVVNPVFLWSWVPAWAAVLSAAISGPPSREASAKEAAVPLKVQ